MGQARGHCRRPRGPERRRSPGAVGGGGDCAGEGEGARGRGQGLGHELASGRLLDTLLTGPAWLSGQSRGGGLGGLHGRGDPGTRFRGVLEGRTHYPCFDDHSRSFLHRCPGRSTAGPRPGSLVPPACPESPAPHACPLLQESQATRVATLGPWSQPEGAQGHSETTARCSHTCMRVRGPARVVTGAASGFSFREPGPPPTISHLARGPAGGEHAPTPPSPLICRGSAVSSGGRTGACGCPRAKGSGSGRGRSHSGEGLRAPIVVFLPAYGRARGSDAAGGFS